MDVKDYAGIGGVLFAIYRHFFPKNPLKYDLSFVREKEIELTSEPFEIFSKLQFVYKEQPLVNVKLFEFSIRNTGNMDITAEMLREPIVIQFSDSYEILESKINNLSNNSKLWLNIESTCYLYIGTY